MLYEVKLEINFTMIIQIIVALILMLTLNIQCPNNCIKTYKCLIKNPDFRNIRPLPQSMIGFLWIRGKYLATYIPGYPLH